MTTSPSLADLSRMNIPAWHKSQLITAESFLQWEQYLFSRGHFEGADPGIESIDENSVSIQGTTVTVKSVRGLTHTGYPVVLSENGSDQLTAEWPSQAKGLHIFIAVHTPFTKEELTGDKTPSKFWLKLVEKINEEGDEGYPKDCLYLGEWQEEGGKLILRNKPLPRNLGVLRPVLGENDWWEWVKLLHERIEKLPSKKKEASGLRFLPCVTTTRMSQLSRVLFSCSLPLEADDRRPGLTPTEEGLLREKQTPLHALVADKLVSKLIELPFLNDDFYEEGVDFNLVQDERNPRTYFLSATDGKTLTVSRIKLSLCNNPPPAPTVTIDNSGQIVRHLGEGVWELSEAKDLKSETPWILRSIYKNDSVSEWCKIPKKNG